MKKETAFEEFEGGWARHQSSIYLFLFTPTIDDQIPPPLIGRCRM